MKNLFFALTALVFIAPVHGAESIETELKTTRIQPPIFSDSPWKQCATAIETQIRTKNPNLASFSIKLGENVVIPASQTCTLKFLENEVPSDVVLRNFALTLGCGVKEGVDSVTLLRLIPVPPGPPKNVMTDEDKQ